MIRIALENQLYLGNARDARDLQQLHDWGVAAVVDLAINESPAVLARDMVYCRHPIHDGAGNASEAIKIAICCVSMLLDNKVRTLVACSAGMSRSPAIAAAAIAVHTRAPLSDCLTRIAESGPHDVSPLLWQHVESAYNRLTTPGTN